MLAPISLHQAREPFRQIAAISSLPPPTLRIPGTNADRLRVRFRQRDRHGPSHARGRGSGERRRRLVDSNRYTRCTNRNANRGCRAGRKNLPQPTLGPMWALETVEAIHRAPPTTKDESGKNRHDNDSPLPRHHRPVAFTIRRKGGVGGAYEAPTCRRGKRPVRLGQKKTRARRHGENQTIGEARRSVRYGCLLWWCSLVAERGKKTGSLSYTQMSCPLTMLYRSTPF